MKFSHKLAVGLFLSLVPAGLSHADESEKYDYSVSTTVQAGLTHGPNAIGFVRKNMTYIIRTSTPITTANASSVTASGILIGRYPSTKGMVELQLRIKVDKQQLETNYTPSQIDAIVYEWEETYSTPVPLKSLQPQVKSLKFEEGAGLYYNCALKKNSTYLLSFHIPYDEAQHKLADLMPDLKLVKKFIGSIESDLHGRTILQNNKSGMPPFITFENTEEGARVVRLHHPMHDIFYQPAKKTWSYFYVDTVADVSKLPEIKRLLANPEVKSFVFEKPSGIQVRAEGGPGKGYAVSFNRTDATGQLKTQIDKKNKVTIEK